VVTIWLQKARARQPTTRKKRHNEAPPLVLGKTEVTLRSEPYISKIGRNHKLVELCLGPFSVFEGPDKYANYKLNLTPIMQGIHLWIHCRHLRIYLRLGIKAFPGLPEMASKEPFTIAGSRQEELEIENVLKN